MVQLLQNLADEFADLAQGMVRGIRFSRMNVRKHPALILKPSAHLQSSRRIGGELNHHSFALARFFSKLLKQKMPAGRAAKEDVISANAGLKSHLWAVFSFKDVESVDTAAIWARRILPAKNSLSIVDTRQLENAFEERLAALKDARPSRLGSMHKHATTLERKGSESTRTSIVEKIETSGLTHPEPRRVRDREHVKFVARHPCLICGRRPADPHHLRFAQSRALGRKVSDEFTVPLCRGHHREVHRSGDEAAWWAKVGVEPVEVANALWRETHPLT